MVQPGGGPARPVADGGLGRFARPHRALKRSQRQGSEAATEEGPLHPYRALDLTDELGWLCGRILADLGADVVKVEPPGGEPGRRQPPLIGGDGGGKAVGLQWLAFNAGKRGITLDLETAPGKEILGRLAETADFLLESFAPGHLASLGLGWPDLRERNPRLILTSITPYGQQGPDAGAPASDLELMAAGGAVWLAGDPDRPPVRITQPQSPGWTGLHAAMGTLMAHHHRERTGQGQLVDVSAQASVLPALAHAPTFWEMLGENPKRAGPYLTGRNVGGTAMRNIWPCQDGYVTFAIYGGEAGRHSNRQLVAWMAERGMAPDFLAAMDWDRFDVATVPAADVERLEAALVPFFLSLTRQEFVDGAVSRRILGYAVATVEDIARDRQLMARDVWQDIDDPWLGRRLRFPTGAMRFGTGPPRLRRSAPAVGEHNQEILGGELGLSPAELGTLPVG